MRSPRAVVVAVASVLAACGGGELDGGSPAVAPASSAKVSPTRQRLGIPAGAARVLVVGQNSHLDLDWQRTTESYFTNYVRRIFDEALDAIAADPGYRYAIAEMEFLRRYVEQRPERRAELDAALASGQLQIVGGGVSSPDVLLPLGEALIRDYARGHAFVRSLGAEPTRSAWHPDSFGHGPASPDVLASLGIRATAFWRVDGTPDSPEFSATIATFAKHDVAPQSSAAMLKQRGVADFVWRGPGGGEVLGHWLTHGYMFGDYLPYETIDFRLLGKHFGTELDDPARVADNLQTAIDILTPLSPTSNSFIPVGGDFVFPTKRLAEFARAYNQLRFPTTNVWVHAGTFDEYAALVLEERDKLPTIDADFTPYWMGFYASRPELKENARLATAALSSAETAALWAERAGAPYPFDALDAAWWTVSKENHHDWITGTSVPDVFESEQLPESREARASAEALLATATQTVADATEKSGRALVVMNPDGAARSDVLRVATKETFNALGAAGFRVQRDGDDVVVFARDVPAAGYLTTPALDVASDDTPRVTVRCDDGAGTEVACDAAQRVSMVADGKRVDIDLASGGHVALSRFDTEVVRDALGLAIMQDGGGLYTFGHESQCSYVERAALVGAKVDKVEAGAVFGRVTLSLARDGQTYQLVYTLYADMAVLELDAVFSTEGGTTVVTHVPTSSDRVTMAVPGGVTTRAPSPRFSPTFVPFESWAAIATTGGSVTLVAPGHPALGIGKGGVAELVLDRNDQGAMCNPSMFTPGFAGPTTHHRVRLGFHDRAVTTAERYDVAAGWLRPMSGAVSAKSGQLPPTGSWISVGDPRARLSALFRDRDHGVALRLFRPEGGLARVSVDTQALGTQLVRVDGTLRPLGSDADAASVAIDAYTTLLVK